MPTNPIQSIISLQSHQTTTKKVQQTCALFLYHITGFMQPTVAIAMLNVDDYDGWNDRHPFIICPKPVKTYFQDLVPRPEDTLCLGKVLLQIRRCNQEPTTYNLSPEATQTFKKFYNEAVDSIHGVSFIIITLTLAFTVIFPLLFVQIDEILVS